MKKMKENEISEKEEKALLTFLKLTREGKYARVEESSLIYIRLKEQREETYEQEYYYSVR